MKSTVIENSIFHTTIAVCAELNCLRNSSDNRNCMTYGLTGSVNLFFRGFEIVPKDIDFVVSSDYLGAIETRFTDKLDYDLHFLYSEVDDIRSSFCEFELDGLPVQFMANISNKSLDNTWILNRDWENCIESIRFCGVDIMLISLEHELEIAILKGDVKRISRIRGFLNGA
jgi:hypothetical protein